MSIAYIIPQKPPTYRIPKPPTSTPSKFLPPTIAQLYDRHSPYPRTITNVTWKPLHHQNQFHNGAPLNHKSLNTLNLQQTKTTKCRKKKQNLGFWHPQLFMMPNCPLTCCLLLIIHQVLGFSLSIFPHPQVNSSTLVLHYTQLEKLPHDFFQHNIPWCWHVAINIILLFLFPKISLFTLGIIEKLDVHTVAH